MSSLLLILDDGERRLPEQDPHYLWMDAGVLKVSTNPPSHEACVGHFVCEFGGWWFHSGPAECPPELRINGRPAADDVELATGRAEVRLSAEPFSEPAPRDWAHGSSYDPVPQGGPAPAGHPADAVRQYVIGPYGTGAQILVDDPAAVPDHAVVEEDGRGAWWITAHNGEVFVDGESVTSAVLEPGAAFVIGRRVLTVPDSGRRGRGMTVECAGLTVRRGGHQILDNVSLTIAAGGFAVVYSPDRAGAQMLLGLLIGGYKADDGTVRVGGSSRKGNPAVRWVPPTDDLHTLLTVRETLAGADQLDEVLSWMGLSGEADRQVRALDDAARKRLAIARECAERPAVLVVFEAEGAYTISGDRDLMSRLATVSRDTGCTIVVAGRTVGNLDLARTVVVLDRRGRLRYAGPPGGTFDSRSGVSRAEWLATLDVPSGNHEGDRHEPPVRLPAMRLRPGAAGGLDGLSAMLPRQWLLFRRRGNGVLLGLPLFALVGAAVAVAVHAVAVAMLAAVAVICALATGGVGFATQRAVLARERRSGTSAGAVVTADLVVHGSVCAVLAVPMATAADIAGTRLPHLPGHATWFSLWLPLYLVMLLSLAGGMLVTAAVPDDDLTPTVAVAVGVVTVASLILMCWLLLGVGWAVCLPTLVVLAVAASASTTAVLDSRIS